MKRGTARTILVGAVALPLLSYCWLCFGIFSDREFGTLYLFKKHRLSPRIFFYAPVGESDGPVPRLSPRAQRAEADFQELVERGGGYDHKLRLYPW